MLYRPYFHLTSVRRAQECILSLHYCDLPGSQSRIRFNKSKDTFRPNVGTGCFPEYVSIMKVLYSHITGRVRAYSQLSECFRTSSGVRQACPLPPFLFNFVMGDILGQARKNSVANFSNAQDETSFTLKHANNIVCTLETFTDAQSLTL